MRRRRAAAGGCCRVSRLGKLFALWLVCAFAVVEFMRPELLTRARGAFASQQILIEASGGDVRASGGDDDAPEPATDGSVHATAADTTNGASYDDDDPIDDFKYLTGFPSAPVSLDEMRMCDESWQIHYRPPKKGQHTMKCETDPTCRECYATDVSRFEELQSAYRGLDHQPSRLASYAEKFKNSKVAVSFAVNWAHLDLFLNWACSAYNIGLDPRTFSTIAPTDAKTHAKLSKLGFHTVGAEWIPAERKITQGEAKWGRSHSDINNVAMFNLIDLLSLNKSVLVSDVDVVWLKNPLDFLARAAERRDLVGMLAPWWDGKGILNTGFFYARPSAKTKIFAQTVENVAPLKSWSDQLLYNSVMRHVYFHQLEWRLLPQELIYKYSGRRHWKPGHSTLVFHAVGSDKRAKTESMGFWYLSKEKCGNAPFFDSEIADRAEGVLKQERARRQPVG